MRVPGYQNLMRSTGNPDRDRALAIQAAWLNDPRNLPAVLMAIAIAKKQQDAGSGEGSGSGNTEEAQ